MKNIKKRLRELRAALIESKEGPKHIKERDADILRASSMADGMINFEGLERIDKNDITKEKIYALLSDIINDTFRIIMMRGEDAINANLEKVDLLFELKNAKECLFVGTSEFDYIPKTYFETNLNTYSVSYVNRKQNDSEKYMAANLVYTAKNGPLEMYTLGSFVKNMGLIPAKDHKVYNKGREK